MIVLNEKHSLLYTAKTRYFILTGGRGSGKSFPTNTFIENLSFERGHKILFTRYTMTSAEVSIIPEFREKIDLMQHDKYFEVTKNSIYNKRSGSEIIFKGIHTSSGDQTANLKSLQGITTWVLDEAEELTDEAKFEKIDLSVRVKGIHNRVILILNPTTKEHWIYQRFFESKGVEPGFTGTVGDVTYIHTTYLDNLDNLDSSFLNIIEQMKIENPSKYEHQILGGWLSKAEGVVFNNWTVGEFNNDLPYLFGQDFGFSIDPTTLVQVAIDKNHKKIYLREMYYKPKLVTSEIAELNRQYANNTLIIADSAEPRLIEELAARGINIKPTEKGQGSVSAGIALMQDYQIVVSPDSLNIAKELNNYAWSDKKSGVPIDAWNHAIDAARYCIFYQLANPNRGKYFYG